MESASFPSAEAFLAERDQAAFDCIILDIQLGGMSGLELQARLVSEGDAVPVIFITAHDNAASRREAAASGCAGFFRKTDPGVEIIEAIRDTVACPRNIPHNAARHIEE
jgi:FixJ family two-component response regulator